MGKGFTLIELLIVIIIIAILASIAVPQLFKVAERARAAEAVQILGSIRRAQLRYYAEHGNLTDSDNDLDYDMVPSKYFENITPYASTYTGGGETVASATRNTISNPGYGSYILTIHGNGEITCSGGIRCPVGF